MIPWPGDTIHDPERPSGCWAERNGNECGRPAGPDGVCDPCRDRIRGLTPKGVGGYSVGIGKEPKPQGGKP